MLEKWSPFLISSSYFPATFMWRPWQSCGVTWCRKMNSVIPSLFSFVCLRPVASVLQMRSKKTLLRLDFHFRRMNYDCDGIDEKICVIDTNVARAAGWYHFHSDTMVGRPVGGSSKRDNFINLFNIKTVFVAVWASFIVHTNNLPVLA